MPVKSERYVPIETIGVGDIARFAWVDGDVSRTASGRVGNIERRGYMRLLTAEDGGLLAAYSTEKPRAVKATILQRYEPQGPALFDLDADDG